MTTSTYRPEVDGLRAVAVILVLAFHTRLGFPGGYVGVDVFFVISGYLITDLIVRQQRSGTFTLSGFWGRRIRRIIPAACLVIFVTLIAGAVLLFPGDYKELANSTLAQQLMLSNVFFWRNTGYFRGNAELKPLLHTWSLAVEEQFYLAYPFLLALLGRLRPFATACILSVGALASFGICEWGSIHYPSATFYLLPTRAWELLLGALLCFIPSKLFANRYVSQVLSLVGLALVIAAASLFDATTRFPGVTALVPCFGTALLICSNSAGLTSIGRVLALKPVVFVGLISYSLYLIHWPILAYSRYWLGTSLSLVATAIVLAVTFLLAVLSWRFVETPLRSGKFAMQRLVLMGICATVPLLIALSTLVLMGHGLPARFSESVLRYHAVSFENPHTFGHEMRITPVCEGKLPTFGASQGPVKCLVWGDSHAKALMPGIDAACKSKKLRGYQATRSVTAPILNFAVIRNDGKEDPKTLNRAVFDFVIKNKIDVVVLAGLWRVYARQPEFEFELKKTIKELRSSGVDVVVVLDVATQKDDVPRVLARRAWFGLPTNDIGVSNEVYQSQNRSCNEIIQRVAKGEALIADPAPFLVDGNGVWRGEIGGTVLYRDEGHLASAGALRLTGLFEKILEQSLENHASGDGRSSK